MLKVKFLFVSLTSLFFLVSLAGSEAQSRQKQKAIPAHLAADYIHAVIETDRTIYSQYIVERLGETVSLKASEKWERELPRHPWAVCWNVPG